MITEANQVPKEPEMIETVRRRYDRSLNTVADTVGVSSNFVSSNYNKAKDASVSRLNEVTSTGMAHFAAAKDNTVEFVTENVNELTEKIKKMF